MYQIVSDGACDLSQEIVEKYNLKTVPFYVSMDSKKYYKEMVELKVRDFYQFMVDNPKIFPKTSMPAVQEYLNVFEPIVKEGQDIICFCITTNLSGSYNSAISARDIILEQYPKAKIEVIDTRTVTVLQGMLVIEALKMQQANYSFEQVLSKVEEMKETARIFFTINTMDYLVNGGRVGKITGIAGGTLGLKPLIIFKDGDIIKGGVTRGRIKSKQKTIELLMNYLEEEKINLNEYQFTIGYGYDKIEVLTFKENIENSIKEKFPDFNQEILISQIGATIGVHTGPNPIGIGMIKKYNY